MPFRQPQIRFFDARAGGSTVRKEPGSAYRCLVGAKEPVGAPESDRHFPANLP
jgi:hypothetical protein